MIEFVKYHGTGNDFILIDNRSGNFQHDKKKFARKWCKRRFGIGSDGLIFIEKADMADFAMDFYNPDGSQSFCGNGSRCAVSYAHRLGIFKNTRVSFTAIDGMHVADFTEEKISVKMKDVEKFQHLGTDLLIQTGSPHYVCFDEQNKKDIISFGKEIRYSDRFKEEGTNVNLVKTLSCNYIAVKTYERGVEDETFSCGTGVTACALAYAFRNELNFGTITVHVKGGSLSVKFERYENGYRNIWLEGPAQFVYQGIIHDEIA